MTDMEGLKIAVISDLHAWDGQQEGDPPSSLNINDAVTEPTLHPIAGLKDLITQQGLHADILICAGDLTDKAKPAPLHYAWNHIHSLGADLKVTDLVATAGNHDMDSRYVYNDHDARGLVQSVSPRFPVDDVSLFDQYWSRNFAVVRGDRYRVVTLNSCAHHGSGEQEHLHGRISRHTISWLAEDLAKDDIPFEYNILVCHHHPAPIAELRGQDYEAMHRGADLLDLLGSGKYGRWIIIHGHKHLPKISYAGGIATSPVVFSAGSISAKLYADHQGKARNQFYLIELKPPREGLTAVMGHGRAWDWVRGSGWQPAGPDSGIPGYFGFGCRRDPDEIAAVMSGMLASTQDWATVESAIPDVRFMLPGDFESLEARLDSAYGIRIARIGDKPIQVGKWD